MITKTLIAIGYGVQAGANVTKWLMKDDIEKGKEILKRTPILKNYEIQTPFKRKKTKGVK